jgi:hypothetical protein
MSAAAVASATKAGTENEPVIATLKRCDTKSYFKKRNRALGPVSGASVEMRLHRNLAPLTQRIVRARFTSAGASHASKGSKGRGREHESK